jgi:transcriptional regulator with XRE-family HTH domain
MASPEFELWTARQRLIPQRLRQRRCELGLTQKQVVTRLGRFGVRTSNRALSSIEHGAGIDVAKLPELAVALDCTVTYLIGLTDDPHRWEPDSAFAPNVTRAPASVTQLRPVSLAAAKESSLILGDDVPDRGRRYDLS